MRGSTRISAHLDPEINKKIVKIFLMQMAQVIDTYNGFVYKFIGDCVVGVFPADTNFTGMSDNAIQAAMMMRNVVEDVINPVFDKKGLPRIGLHIGLDIGTALVDTFGANKTAAFDELIGFTMNVASKIVECAKDDEILLGRSLFEVLHVNWLEFCRETTLDQEWTITDPVRGGKYKVYQFNGMWKY
jgi:class 3 adenylate cyclase